LSTRIGNVTGKEIELDETTRSYHTGERAAVKLLAPAYHRKTRRGIQPPCP